MRPLLLKMTAFGPYASQAVIDFDKLGKSGIYLITGTTGAGKTSIFDGITYALFGEPSGSFRAESNLRSMYADALTPTEVELKFEYNNKIYTVTRSPEYERPSKRGGGTTKQPPQSRLVYPDGRIVDKSKREVNLAVEQILGINRNQFLQISMIAQGDFMKLITASTEDRKAIFRQIFKTQKFETLQLRLKSDAKELSEQISLQNERLKVHYNSIAIEDGNILNGEVQKAKNLELASCDVLSLLERLIDGDTTIFDGLKQKLTELQNQISQVKIELLKAQDYIKSKGLLAEKQAVCQENNQKLQVATQTLDKLKEQTPQCEEWDRAIALLTSDLPRYDELDNLLIKMGGLQARVAKNKATFDGGCERLIAHDQDIEKDKQIFSTLKDSLAKKEKKESEKQQLLTAISELNALQLLIKDYEKNLLSLQDAKAVYQSHYANYIKAQEEFSVKNKLFLDGQAGILASTLEDGAPCPVCGAINHPKLAQTTDEIPTESELKTLKESCDNLLALTQQASEKASQINGNCSEQIKNIESALVKIGEGVTIDNAKIVLNDKERGLKQALAEIENQIKIESANVKRANELEKQIENNEKLSKEMATALSKIDKSIGEDNATIKQLERSVISLQSSLKYSSKDDAQSQLNDLRVKSKAFKDSKEKAQVEVDKLTATINTLNGEIKALEKIVNEGSAGDATALSDRQTALQTQIDECQAQKENVATRLAKNKECYQNVESVSKEIAGLEKRYIWMQNLSETANGTLRGRNKIMFETFVQMSYFDRILHRANLRLNKMTGGQYDLIRRKEPESQRTQVGLDIDVIDHYNGTTRAISTLSGGESFKASLSLALGLSDEIQSSSGGVVLDTMFVDEGFGSLDDESLKLAISTLQELAEGDRLVGIISHVNELKTKIDKQIVVTKEKSGGSVVKVVV